MKARGFTTALGTALAGISIGLAAPAGAAPEGPDGIDDTAIEQQEHSVVVLDRLGNAPLDRAKMSGTQSGLGPLQLTGDIIYVGVS